MQVDDTADYPTALFNFNPDTVYPEYLWGTAEISEEKNQIYSMVRQCLAGLKMDIANFNTPGWNPFGEFITEGDTVVIKPNWVMHFNKNKAVRENSLECLITHPSVARAVIDYCLIALKGTGKIVIGDAPMQGCDLNRLINSSGYRELFRFYNDKSIDLKPTDFRKYATIVKNNVLVGKKYNTNEFIEVNLDSTSKFSSVDSSVKRYKVSDYDDKITNLYHNEQTHRYTINKEILSADVVINLCKPKCHRLAGLTAAVKNFVGVTFDKACLPHRTMGSRFEGGDEYLYTSHLKKLIGKVLDKKISYEEQDCHAISFIMRYIYGGLYYLMKYVSKDKFLIGSWYGNDTIWRTVLDLYFIVLYADKSGIIQDSKQRKVFNIADMIISGERNGPVSPEPKKIGLIIAGYDAVVLDRLVCEIMGFDYTRIPSIFYSINDCNLSDESVMPCVLYSNLSDYTMKPIDELVFPDKWRFKPYDSWKGSIEKKNCSTDTFISEGAT
jgi:uncharacterized protein (DUF362 family)